MPVKNDTKVLGMHRENPARPRFQHLGGSRRRYGFLDCFRQECYKTCKQEVLWNARVKITSNIYFGPDTQIYKVNPRQMRPRAPEHRTSMLRTALKTHNICEPHTESQVPQMQHIVSCLAISSECTTVRFSGGYLLADARPRNIGVQS